MTEPRAPYQAGDDTLAELEKLYQAGTPGRWASSNRDEVWSFGEDDRCVQISVFLTKDAALIVALHNAYPSLVTRVREAEEEEAQANISLIASLADNDKLAARMRDAEQRNQLFVDCMRRGMRLWRDAHPGVDQFPSGDENISWLLERLRAAEACIQEIDRLYSPAKLYLYCPWCMNEVGVIGHKLDCVYLAWQKVKCGEE